MNFDWFGDSEKNFDFRFWFFDFRFSIFIFRFRFPRGPKEGTCMTSKWHWSCADSRIFWVSRLRILEPLPTHIFQRCYQIGKNYPSFRTSTQVLGWNIITMSYKSHNIMKYWLVTWTLSTKWSSLLTRTISLNSQL